MKNVLELILSVIKLEKGFFQEIKNSERVFTDAVAVIVIYSLATGVGNMGRMGFFGFFPAALGALVMFLVWVFVIYFILGKSAGDSSLKMDFLKIAGFCSAPGIIKILGIIHSLYWPALIISNILMMLSLAQAAGEVLNIDNRPDLFKKTAFAWLIMIIIMRVLAMAAKIAIV